MGVSKSESLIAHHQATTEKMTIRTDTGDRAWLGTVLGALIRANVRLINLHPALLKISKRIHIVFVGQQVGLSTFEPTQAFKIVFTQIPSEPY